MLSHFMRLKCGLIRNVPSNCLSGVENVLCTHPVSVTSHKLLQTSASKRNNREELTTTSDERGLKIEKSSKAMRAYLERAQKHSAFMKTKTEEFTTGKRHLANMMGVDPETFTQKDVDEAIEYLFPSGLFVPGARPLMRPPEQVFPPKKEAEFDESGRPFHHFFYTGKPNYFGILYDLAEELILLNKYEDTMIRKHLQPDPNVRIELTGSNWISKEVLEKRLVEEITDKEYASFVQLLDRLVSHPYSYNIKDKIMDLRQVLMAKSKDLTDPGEPNYDETGRAYFTTTACPRKSSRATVTVRYPGTGLVSINGRDLSYFKHIQPREQILFPLQFTGLLNKVDIEATVEKGGSSGQAGAVRYGISNGLRFFVSKEMIEKMRLAGLLTRDVRHRERKKAGQWKARRKYTWKKR